MNNIPNDLRQIIKQVIALNNADMHDSTTILLRIQKLEEIYKQYRTSEEVAKDNYNNSSESIKHLKVKRNQV